MSIPDGIVPFENQGPYPEYVGPIEVRQGGDALVLARTRPGGLGRRRPRRAPV